MQSAKYAINHKIERMIDRFSFMVMLLDLSGEYFEIKMKKVA